MLIKGKSGVLAAFRKSARELLGQGSYKRVFDAVWIQQNKEREIESFEVAIAKPRKKEQKSFENLQSEVSIDTLLPKNPYLLRLIDSIEYSKNGEKKLVLVYPRAQYGLHEWGLDPREVQKAIRCILEGVVSLHAEGLSHGDLKPANFLAKEGFEHFWVSDFGFLSQFGSDARLGTFGYRAPEGIRGLHEPDDCGRIDSWALGISFCELLTGERPLTDTDLTSFQKEDIDEKVLQNIVDRFLDQRKASIEERFPKFFKILHGLLRVHIDDRFTTIHALNALNCLDLD
jgi:serine/threonine protein kinase